MMDSGNDAIMDIADLARGIKGQADHILHNDAPVTARIVLAQLAILRSDTLCGHRMVNWPGKPLEDAMPLRLAGGLHHLQLTGAETRLAPIYAGEVTDQAEVDAIVLAVARDHDERLLGWFDGPPQTNEAGRSAGIMAGLLWLAERLGPRFELIELGASAGINTLMDRYGYDLGGVKPGPQNSPIQIAPEWRGPPPPDFPVEIVSIEGCDLSPVDLTDPEAALRLKSYVWPENAARLARVDAAIALAAERKPKLEQADAGDFVARQLARPQDQGVTRVLFHSIVWQYLPPETRQRIEDAMEEAGRSATVDRPLAWIMLETNRQTFQHELQVRYWPGQGESGGDWALLGQAHAHGAWVEWFGSD